MRVVDQIDNWLKFQKGRPSIPWRNREEVYFLTYQLAKHSDIRNGPRQVQTENEVHLQANERRRKGSKPCESRYSKSFKELARVLCLLSLIGSWMDIYLAYIYVEKWSRSYSYLYSSGYYSAKEKRKKAIREHDLIFYCQITQAFLYSLSLLLTRVVVSNISKMKFSPFIFSAAALGVSQPALQKCGVGDPSPELRELARTMQTSLDHVKRDNSTLVIPTYLHVVESAEREGTVRTKMLEDQVCKMA